MDDITQEVNDETAGEPTAAGEEITQSGEEETSEFTYDENGNVIVEEPDFTDEEFPLEDFGEDPENGQPEDQTDTDDENGEGTVDTDAGDGQADTEGSDELTRVKEELDRIKTAAKKVIKTMNGNDSEDVEHDLYELAGEASPDENAGTDERSYVMRKFEEKMRSEMQRIKAAYPSVGYESVKDLPNFERYARLVDAGATPEEAFAATHQSEIREGILSAAKQKSISGTKEHLKSNVPAGTKDTSVKMSREELSEWKDLFPEKSESEIRELYKNTKD